jgi:hypothetical protein
MTRCLRPVLGAALIFIALVAPRPAFAGGYDVISCNQTVAGGANHSWGAAADGGMTAYTDCPPGRGSWPAACTGSESAAQYQPHALARHDLGMTCSARRHATRATKSSASMAVVGSTPSQTPAISSDVARPEARPSSAQIPAAIVSTTCAC